MCLNYESLKPPETSIFKYSGYKYTRYCSAQLLISVILLYSLSKPVVSSFVFIDFCLHNAIVNYTLCDLYNLIINSVVE